MNFIKENEKIISITAHLLILLNIVPAVGLILLFCAWHYSKNVSPLVRNETRKALNFQLTILVATLIWGVFTLITFGILSFLAIFGLIYITIFAVLAAVNVANNKTSNYPFTIIFIAD